MKGDIAVAGFMMTAEEWQALDSVSRAQLVAVITRREDPMIASGSGPTVVAARLATGTLPPVTPPVLADGTNPVQLAAPATLADGTNPVRLAGTTLAAGSSPVQLSATTLAEGTNPGIEVPDLIEELPSGAVSLIESSPSGAVSLVEPSPSAIP